MKPLIVQFFVPAKEYKDPTYNQIGVNDELLNIPLGLSKSTVKDLR